MNHASISQVKTTAQISKSFLSVGIAIGYFMVMLDMTVLTVALPAVRQDLGGGFAGMQWAVNAYTIIYACLLLTAGALADQFGAKRLFVGGLAIFLVASALSAAAPTLGVLIALRAVLGVGGAALLPASLTLIAHAFPGASERARALGVWAAVSGAALAAGPIVGGVLVDTWGWRSIFMLNVPVGLVSIVIALIGVSETARQPQQGFDAGGQLSAVTGVAALTFALVEGGTIGWDASSVILAFFVAFASLISFLLFEARVKSPMLPLRLFRNPTFSVVMVAGLVINFAMSGLLFLLTLYFQQSRGLSAFNTGLAFLPMTVPMAFNPLFTGRLVGRIGSKPPIVAGFVLTAGGTLMQLWTSPHSPYAVILIGLLVLSFGISFTIPSLLAAAISSVSKEQPGIASGALNSSRQLGAVLGVALLGAIANASSTFVAGMHMSLIITSAMLLTTGALSLVCMRTGHAHPPRRAEG